MAKCAAHELSNHFLERGFGGLLLAGDGCRRQDVTRIDTIDENPHLSGSHLVFCFSDVFRRFFACEVPVRRVNGGQQEDSPSPPLPCGALAGAVRAAVTWLLDQHTH